MKLSSIRLTKHSPVNIFDSSGHRCFVPQINHCALFQQYVRNTRQTIKYVVRFDS